VVRSVVYYRQEGSTQFSQDPQLIPCCHPSASLTWNPSGFHLYDISFAHFLVIVMPPSSSPLAEAEQKELPDPAFSAFRTELNKPLLCALVTLGHFLTASENNLIRLD
jgi:hypothetical protein